MAQFLGDIAGLLEIFAIAAGLVLLHRAAKEAPARLLSIAGWVLVVGGIATGLCTTYYWFQYQARGDFDTAASWHHAMPDSWQRSMPMAGPGMMQSSPMMMTQQLGAPCPMELDDVQVQVSDTESGVALTFTTPSGDVDALRQRVHLMGAMYGMHGGRGHMMWRHMDGPGMMHGMGHGRMHGPMPAVSVTIEDVEQGARIIMTPTDPAQLDALRQRTRMHQQRMQSGACGMWQQGSTSDSAAG